MNILINILIIAIVLTIGVILTRIGFKNLDIKIFKKGNSDVSNDNNDFVNFVKENTDDKEFSEFVEQSINNSDETNNKICDVVIKKEDK